LPAISNNPDVLLFSSTVMRRRFWSVLWPDTQSWRRRDQRDL